MNPHVYEQPVSPLGTPFEGLCETCWFPRQNPWHVGEAQAPTSPDRRNILDLDDADDYEDESDAASAHVEDQPCVRCGAEIEPDLSLCLDCRQTVLDVVRERRPQREGFCEQCGAELWGAASRCISCRDEALQDDAAQAIGEEGGAFEPLHVGSKVVSVEARLREVGMSFPPREPEGLDGDVDEVEVSWRERGIVGRQSAETADLVDEGAQWFYLCGCGSPLDAPSEVFCEKCAVEHVCSTCGYDLSVNDSVRTCSSCRYQEATRAAAAAKAEEDTRTWRTVRIAAVLAVVGLAWWLANNDGDDAARDYRVGAVCADGSESSATGNGACSNHGGVSRWLYEDQAGQDPLDDPVRR